MLVKCLHELKLVRVNVGKACSYAVRWIRCFTPVVCVGLLAALIAVWLLHSWDAPIVDAAAKFRRDVPHLITVARWLSYVGDFLGFNVLLFATLLVVGGFLDSLRLRRLAIASLLCSCFAGASANIARPLTGRPRPSTPAPDGLYGPSLKTSMHALPSAHSATAFGGALPVLLAEPRLGAPLVAFAVSVGWSRIQLDRHRLTDVLVSFVLALAFSLPLSQWVGQRGLPARAPTPLTTPHELAAPRHPL